MKFLAPILIYASALLALNPQLFGLETEAFFFHLPSFLDGEFWRLLTVTFAHSSWGHLIAGGLTTIAFLLMLPLRHWLPLYLAGALGSTLLPLALSPETHTQYLGGVSGITHGLVVACVWPLLRSEDRTERIIAWSSLLLVYAKVIYESATGILIDFGLVAGFIEGFCKDGHLGGVLGITLYCLACRFFKRVRGHASSSTLQSLSNSAPESHCTP